MVGRPLTETSVLEAEEPLQSSPGKRGGWRDPMVDLRSAQPVKWRRLRSSLPDGAGNGPHAQVDKAVSGGTLRLQLVNPVGWVC